MSEASRASLRRRVTYDIRIPHARQLDSNASRQKRHRRFNRGGR